MAQAQVRIGEKFETENRPPLSPREAALVRCVPLIAYRASAEQIQVVLPTLKSAGVTERDFKEVLLQLSIYVGFPKTLEMFKKLKTLRELFAAPAPAGNAMTDPLPEQPTAISPSDVKAFNFFKLPEVEGALNAIDPDFARYALMNAVSLCDRPGLSARERAILIWTSDICNEVFEGPFQIHTEMALKSKVTLSELRSVLDVISHDLPSGWLAQNALEILKLF